MACPVACVGDPSRPKSPSRAPRQRVMISPSAPGAQGRDGSQVIQEVTEETVYETFDEGSGEVSEEKQKVLKEDLKRVHQARRKLITDIYARMPVNI